MGCDPEVYGGPEGMRQKEIKRGKKKITLKKKSQGLGGRVTFISVSYSGRHPAELLTWIPYLNSLTNSTRWSNCSSILQMRRLRPGTILHQI